MGLCKCPRRRVTPLFCFEHRVNVCESCMLSNHPKCVVQSYLRWLQDSDYEPNCPLCNRELRAGDTVRLVCYDLFHWRCLSTRYVSLPPHTAPSGFRCPSCNAPLFPPPESRGPVADALRSRLANVAWARPGLGLPLIEDADIEPEPSDGSEWGESSDPPAAPEPPPSPELPSTHTVVHVGGGESLGLHGSAPRKALWGRENRTPPPQNNQEDDKYRRRPHGGGLPHRIRCRPRSPPLVVLLLLLPLLGLLLLWGRLGGGDLSPPPPPLGVEPLRPGR